MGKRGQILGLPLILVFALIVGAFILLYGAKVILDLQMEADYVDFLEQLGDFDATLQTFGNYDVGSSKVYTLAFPKDIETVCLYDASQGVSCQLDGDACSSEIEGELEILLEDTYTVYIFPQGLYDRSRFTLDKFTVDEGNPVCVSNGGRILVRSEDGYVSVAFYESA